MTRHRALIIIASIALLLGALFIYLRKVAPLPVNEMVGPELVATSTLLIVRPVPVHGITAIQPVTSYGTAFVVATSSKVFAYAHGTALADGELFIGMADTASNPFGTNQIVIFGDPADISHPNIISLPVGGDIETMTYDKIHDKVYFVLSGPQALVIYALDPRMYLVSTIIATTTVDAGRKPAIVTDGHYIYGITNTNPSQVFRVNIFTGELAVNSVGHIANGHSAAIGMNGSSTELYFGGGTSNGFEKVDGATLASLGSRTISSCGMSDDMPYVKTSATGGDIFIGCEQYPYGLRMHSTDLSFDRFMLPGASLGLFVYDGNLYNAARDGYVDIIPHADISTLHRYHVNDSAEPLDTNGQKLEVNEILYSPDSGKLFITAWNGVKGLFEVATSTEM